VSDWVVARDGRREDFRVTQRPYAGTGLRDLLLAVGFATVSLSGTLDGRTPCDHAATRLVAVARAPGRSRRHAGFSLKRRRAAGDGRRRVVPEGPVEAPDVSIILDVAATPGTGGTADPFLRVHAVNVYVRDQERSLRFYLETLGFHVAFDARVASGRRMLAVAPPDGTAVLTLVQPDPDSPQCRLIGRATQVVFVTESLTATYREWRRRGVRFVGAPRLRRVVYAEGGPPGHGQAAEAPIGDRRPSVWGGMFVRFEDLDRNSFALVSFDEVSRAIEAQRREIAARQQAERLAAHELEIATQVQARLFPQRLPAMRSLEYAGVCLQTRRVGGDYYDFLDLGQDRLGLVIGDIAGKGMPAALLMANLQANLRSQCAIAVDEPERLLRSVNRLFCENTADNAFATFFYSEFDDRTGRLRYANCGHLPALLLRGDDHVDRLESMAPVLGLFTGWECRTAERQLSPGDVLAIYTDGITEAFNDRDEEFGEERLIGALRAHRHLRPAELVGAILDEVRRFSPQEQRDDITLIVARCRAC
jgi:serine phosphatase RsbU (regulator of sigma subunit)